MDNGQHVFLRCCTSYRALLDRLGVADKVRLQPRLDIPVRSPLHPRPARLRRNNLPAPLHLGGALAKYSLLSPAQRIRFIRAALALRKIDRTSRAVDERSFGSWLREKGQDALTVSALWDLVGVATLNATADEASLALAAMVFQVGLLTDAGAADIGWSLVPLRQLHGEPAHHRLTEAGVELRTGTKIDSVEPRGDRWLVGSGGEEHMADQVVLAVPPRVAERLLPPGSVALPAGWSARLGSSPIINAHVVLDRRVMDGPFVAGVSTPIQWVFDRTEHSGLAGRQRSAGGTEPDGQYLAVSLSAADDMINKTVAELREWLMPELTALLPGVRTATVLDFFVSREPHATFRPGPGSAALRPGAATAAPGLFLAGAWTDTGWPATMESAVRSGESAAAEVLARRGVQGVAA
ncbi:hydroxysqualene dehydroxylase HpnE [Rugosimonospora acidiphila]|uniref:Hydroxysqualene dehydroxylase HpnE n=1 Tax=Rugosimonospora acidiphila TaxID=556531 RepID=A0ABP9SG54_9ACTN